MRIEVEPDTLIGAGQQMGSLGTQLGMLSDALGAALGNGIASGTDAAGLNFGLKYGHQAEDFGNALADAANAFKTVGYLLAATGHNYKNADAASTIGGSGPSGGVGGEPSKTVAGSAPEGPNGATVPPPGSWYLVQPLLHALPGFGLFAGTAMTWPSGDSAMMQVTAAQWRNFATGLAVFEPQLGAVKSAVSAQSIPESAKIVSAMNDLGQAVKSLADVASSVAQSISDFAVGVQETQDAIRRLLDRLSIGGLWDTVTGFLTGEGDDILREIANDVSTVLGNFQRQVKGIVGLLEELVTLIGEAADAFQKWIRPVLIAQFGEDVGGFLAGAVTLYTDFEVGLATGLINTVSGVVSLADADTWKGMAELAASVAQDPSTLPGVLENMGKEFVAWDKWSGDHPGRAAGEAAFNIGSLFVPGGAFSKTGSVAKGLNVTRRMLDEGRLPHLGEVGGWSRGAPKLDGVGTNVPKVPEIPSVKPGTVPPVPKLDSPNGVGPGRLGEPAPTAPGGKAPTAGAEGGPGQRAPIDQPGRGPVDQPGRAPVDDGSRPEPSPAAHDPEPSSPSINHDGDGSASGPEESPSNHAKDDRAGSRDSTPSAEHHRSTAAEDVTERPVGERLSSENDQSNAGAQDTHADDRAHAAEGQQPTHASESESSGELNDGHHADSIDPHHDGNEPADTLQHYDSDGHTIPTDQLVHPHAGLLDQGLLDAAASNPDRVSDALSPGAPSTHPEVQDMVPNDYDPLGGQSEEAWKREYWPSGSRDAHGNPELAWPDPQAHPQGFSTPESRTPAVLEPGEMFDRFGPGFGQFGSPVGTDFPARALPAHSLEAGYHRYEVVRPVPIWQGPIAPAMGQSGGGIQYYFPNSIVDLVNAGYLREVPH